MFYFTKNNSICQHFKLFLCFLSIIFYAVLGIFSIHKYTYTQFHTYLIKGEEIHRIPSP